MRNTATGRPKRRGAKTADYVARVAQAGTMFTNIGAVDVVEFSLPLGAEGLSYQFYVGAAFTLRVLAYAGDNIRLNKHLGVSIESESKGCFIELEFVDDNEWAVTRVIGAWD